MQLASTFVLLRSAARAQAQTSCVDPSSESLRESLNYHDPSSNPDEPCKGCGFFSVSEASCGYCMIMTGPVSSTAHCDSWSSKD
jgi:hypothetical protein